MRKRQAVVLALLVAAWGIGRAQQLKDLEAPSRVKRGDVMVIGFMGGFDRWDDETRAVRKVVLALRGMPGVHAESISNHNGSTAVEFIEHALNKNHNRKVDPKEAAGARIVIFGQGLGSNATLELARTLKERNIPVLLTVQVGRVGTGNFVIPPNVRAAANYGSEIRASDPASTRIIATGSGSQEEIWRQVEGLIREVVNERRP